LDQLLPPLTETCHCTVGVGDPDADAVKDAVVFAATESLEGWLVTLGLVKPVLPWRVAGGVSPCVGKPTTRFV
jgi:hypothetical protein